MYGDYDEMRQKIRQLTQELSVSAYLSDLEIWRVVGSSTPSGWCLNIFEFMMFFANGIKF